HRRRRVEDTSNRVMILFRRIVGEGLYNHPYAVWLERRENMLCGADRIAHIVQAIEKRDQIVAAVDGVAFRAGHFEPDLVEQAIPAGNVPRILNRTAVVVEAVETRLRKRARHEHGGSPVAAAYVRHGRSAGEPSFHPFECRNPRTQKVLLIVGPEEALGAKKEIR